MFSEFKEATFEKSYSFKLDSMPKGIPVDLTFECKVAGPWLLGFKPWIEQMKDVRELHKKMYFSRFPASMESTKKYLLNGPIGNPNQILFLILDLAGTLHGHVGLKLDHKGIVNVDNVLRINNGSPGVMKVALQEILTWGNTTLGVSEYSLRVISTNVRGIALYKELGFSVRERINLKTENFLDGSVILSPSTKNHSNTTEEMLIMNIVL